MSLPSIQTRLDELDPGGTLAMERGDYGPCVITKPVILLCDGSTFWTDGDVPAVVIQSGGVVVKDVNIRALATETHIVLTADKDNHPLFQNVRIFGRVVGIESEPCEWILPPRIDTGNITTHHPGFFIDVAVPQRAQIVCRISGVSMDPSALSPGVNTVKLHISDAMPDSILIGEIEVIGNTLTRLIPFFARITTNAPAETTGSCSQLYDIPANEKERFQKCLSGNAAAAGSLPSSTKISPAAPQRGKQKTQPAPIVEPPQKQPARVSKPADTAQALSRKRKSAPAAQEDPLKLGGAFAESAEEIRTIRRHPIYILADCSGAMSGGPIESVTASINAIHSELMNDPTAMESAFLSVITFGSHAKQVVPLTGICSFNSPKLQASGARVMGEALRLLCQDIDLTASEQNGYKRDYKPLIFIFTGGDPTDDWQQYADNLKAKRPRNIIAVACGDGADKSQLKNITETVLEIKKMSPNDFSAFFTWLSDSGPLPKSETISIDTPPGYTSMNPNLPGKPSALFGGNSLVDKPLDPSNRMETDQGQAKGDQHKAPQTSQLSKLFTDPRD